jgi:hypothetical protein
MLLCLFLGLFVADSHLSIRADRVPGAGMMTRSTSSESSKSELIGMNRERITMRKLVAAGLVAFLASFALACGGQEGEVEDGGPVAVDEGLVREWFSAYLEAHNSHDIEAELAFYADEVIFEVPQNTALMRREDLRPRFEWESVTESQLSMSGIEIDGTTVTITDFVETSSWLQLAGIGEIVYAPGTKIVFTDGLITEVLPSSPSEESQEALGAVMDELMDWVMENRPEELEDMPNGQLPYDGEGARKLLELLTYWRDAQQ